MIEIVSAARCTGCNICVTACPINVFDAVPNGVPVIARQADCQTCFMCELYCPEDALFVAPFADVVRSHESVLADPVTMGAYRSAVGWARGERSTADQDASYELLIRAR